MTEKIKLLTQKRISLKSQITNLSNIIEKGKIDNTALKLRIVRVTELYHAFEEHNDELAILDPDGGHQDKFVNIQESFYSLAGKIENILITTNASLTESSSTPNELRNDNIAIIAPAKKRRIKLPEAPLPTFDGKYENWLSFKNAFSSVVGSQADLSDVDKLHYLKSALIDEAANKIRIFTIDGINYTKAWELLERSYEVKRILISRHLSLLLNMPALDRETTGGLSKLADDTQQHLASLSALGVSVGSEMVVHIIESKLPKVTSERWEACLERDEFPKLDQMYEFLYKAAVYASRRERVKSNESDKGISELLNKRKRGNSLNRSFVLSTSRNCVACKVKRHPLYVCDKFKKLSVPKRIETVRHAKVCYNCLRSHRDNPCTFSNCTICQKRHNTLLHLDKHASMDNPDKSKPVNSEST